MGVQPSPSKEADRRTSPWLVVAGDVGRVAGFFLAVASFVHLCAPVSFLLDLSSVFSRRNLMGAFLTLLSDPVRLLAVGDFIAILGVIVFVFALLLILVGLVRAEGRADYVALLPGCAALACLASWVVVMLYAQGRARGTLGSVDAVAATGGWGLASLLMLGAALAYMVLTLRVERGGKRELTSLLWPVYAAVNVLGSVAIAGFFVTAIGGDEMTAVFAFGLVLKISLIPMLGILAFADLRDRFPAWARVVVASAPPSGQGAEEAPRRVD